MALVEKSGSIFAANKVSEVTQAFLRANDQNLKIRSISIPGLLLKIGFSVVISSKQAGTVKKSCRMKTFYWERDMAWS